MHLICTKRFIESMGSNFEESKTICYSFSSIMSVLWQICNTFEVNFKKTTQIVLKQSKQQFMYLISPKELLSRWVPTLKREQPFAKQQFMHLIITKDVLSLWVPTFKREKPFVTVFLPSF